jgi:hypothetical protein
MPERGRRLNGADRRALIEPFAHLPRLSLLLGARLQVAPRQIEPDGVAEDARQRPIGGDLGAALGERDDEFDLVLQIARQRRIDDVAAAGNQGIRRLAEEERRLARIGAHLGGVSGVVAPDAIDAAHRKDRVAVSDGKDDRRRRREYVAHETSKRTTKTLKIN